MPRPRALLPLLLTVLVVAAGCLGNAPVGTTSTQSPGSPHGGGNGTAASHGASHLVGDLGNEPVVRMASDGTVYVAALQHLYRSTDGGTTWVDVSPGPFATEANLNSDSSLALGPDGSTLYMSFDWPYAGSTAVCMTTDRGDNWTCNPAAVPGVTDRMWIHALPDGRTVLVTGVGLLESQVFVSAAPGTVAYVPASPPPTFHPNVSQSTVADGDVGEQTGDFAVGWGPTAHDGTLVQTGYLGNWTLLSYQPVATPGNDTAPPVFTANETATPFSNGAIPTLARDASGVLYGEDDPGHRLDLVWSSDGGASWHRVPVMTQGLTRFAAVAAGPSGDVSLVFYHSNATKVTNATAWVAMAARITNATSPHPTVSLVQLSPGVVHRGDICSSTACVGNARFAGDFLGAAYDPAGNPGFAFLTDVNHPSHPVVRFAWWPSALPAPQAAGVPSDR